MEKVKEILEAMKEEIPGFVASALVEKEEGLTVAESRKDPDFEISITAAYSVELMRAQERSLEALGQEDAEPDILAIAPKMYFFTRSIPDSNFYIHLILSKEKGTLGLLFAYLKKYSRQIADALREWQAS